MLLCHPREENIPHASGKKVATGDVSRSIAAEDHGHADGTLEFVAHGRFRNRLFLNRPCATNSRVPSAWPWSSAAMLRDTSPVATFLPDACGIFSSRGWQSSIAYSALSAQSSAARV